MKRRGFLGTLIAAGASAAIPFVPSELPSAGNGDNLVLAPEEVVSKRLAIRLVEDRGDGKRHPILDARPLLFDAPAMPHRDMRIQCEEVVWDIDQKYPAVTGVQIWGGKLYGEPWVKYAAFYSPVACWTGDVLKVTYSITCDHDPPPGWNKSA